MASTQQKDIDVVFYGDHGLKMGPFIRHVRRFVIDKRVQDDDRLVAQIAASHLDGKALVWYEEQAATVQESWKVLRAALMKRWPVSDAFGSPIQSEDSPARVSKALPAPVTHKAICLIDHTYTPFFGNAITLRKDDIVDVLAEVGDNSRITKNSFPFEVPSSILKRLEKEKEPITTDVPTPKTVA